MHMMMQWFLMWFYIAWTVVTSVVTGVHKDTNIHTYIHSHQLTQTLGFAYQVVTVCSLLKVVIYINKNSSLL